MPSDPVSTSDQPLTPDPFPNFKIGRWGPVLLLLSHTRMMDRISYYSHETKGLPIGQGFGIQLLKRKSLTPSQ